MHPVVATSIFTVTQNISIGLIFLIVMLETGCGIPFAPGEIAVVSGGIEANNGHLPLIGVILFAAAGAIVGDNIGYLIGRKGGRRLLEAPGPLASKRHRAIEVADPFFERHGSKAVFYGRWLPFLRVFASWFAGGAKMPWRKFVLWNAAGGITWAVSIALLGYTLGATAKTVMDDLGIYGLIAMIIAGATLYVLHRRHQAHVLDDLSEAGAAKLAVTGAPTQPTVGSAVVADTVQPTIASPAVATPGQPTVISRRPDREAPPAE